MEKVRQWCGQPSDRGRLQNRTSYRNVALPAVSGVDPGGGAIASPNKNIPGREYLFAPSKF